MSPFLNLPVEIHFMIISHLEPRVDAGLLSLQCLNKYSNSIFKKYSSTVCRSIGIQRPAYDYINLMRSNLGEQQAFLIQHTLNTAIVDWDDLTFPRNVYGTLSPDYYQFGFKELKALQGFEDVMVHPYVEFIKNCCLPNYVISNAELDRIDKAVVNCHLAVKHIHSVKLAGPKKPYYEWAPAWHTNQQNALLLKDTANEIIIEDDFAIGSDGKDTHTDSLGVLDAKGFMEEFSIEQHMHIVAVLEMLSYRGLNRHRSYSWNFIGTLPPVRFAHRLFAGDFNLPDYLGWLLYARLVDTWAMAKGEVEPKNWNSNRYGTLEHVARRWVNSVIRNSVYDFGQDRLVEFINDTIPKYCFGARTLQKVSFRGSETRLDMASYDDVQLRSVTGRIWVAGGKKAGRMEERELLIPNIKKYGGHWPDGNFTFGRKFSISKRRS